MFAQGFRRGASRTNSDDCASSRLASVKNGKLLHLIADSGKFDLFVTVDKNLPRAQKLAAFQFAIVVLNAKSNRLADLKIFAPELLRRLNEFRHGGIYFL
jgi:hypothetical protein